jgi:hypothetical protein
VTARRLTALLLTALLALVAAGCGGGDKGSGGGSLDDSLGYLPKNAPLVVTVDTDVNGEQYKNLDKLAAKFPFAGQVKNQLKQSISASGVSYDKDVKPLLGNQLVIGATDARALTASGADDKFVVVFPSKDGGKLRAAIEKSKSQQKAGKLDGSDLYKSTSDASVFVIKGDTLVGANDQPTLEAALTRHDGGDKLTENDLNAAFQDLPPQSLVRVYGDAQALIEADPSTATARQVKWVGGLRKFGVTFTAEADGLALDGRVATEGVGAQDLPLAAGDQSPAMARFGDWSSALRNPAQTWRFIENVARTTDSTGFKDFEARKQAIGKKAGIDVDRDLVDQFSGDGTAAGGLDGSWAIRSQVKDPAAMRATLKKLVAARRVSGVSFAQSDGLVESTGKDGGKTYFGMVGDVFVAAKDPAKAKELATVEPRPVSGLKGALVAVVDGEALAKTALQQTGQGGGAAGLFTGPIGDLTTYVTASPNAVRGRVKLKIG